MKKAKTLFVSAIVLFLLVSCNAVPDDLIHTQGHLSARNYEIEQKPISTVFENVQSDALNNSNRSNLDLSKVELVLPRITEVAKFTASVSSTFELGEKDEETFLEITRYSLKIDNIDYQNVYFIGDERDEGSTSNIFTPYSKAKAHPEWKQYVMEYLTDTQGMEYSYSFVQTNCGGIMNLCDYHGYSSSYLPDLNVVEKIDLSAGKDISEISYNLGSGKVELQDAILFAEDYLNGMPYVMNNDIKQHIYEVWVCKVSDDIFAYRFFSYAEYNGMPLDYGQMAYHAVNDDKEPSTNFSFMYMFEENSIDIVRAMRPYEEILNVSPIDSIITLETALNIASAELTDGTVFAIDKICLIWTPYLNETESDALHNNYECIPTWKIVCSKTGIGQYSNLVILVNALTGDVGTYKASDVY